MMVRSVSISMHTMLLAVWYDMGPVYNNSVYLLRDGENNIS